MRWKDFDSIFARGFAVIIIRLLPEFLSLICRVTPGTFPRESSISGSPKISIALSEVSRFTVRPNSVST